MPEKLALPKGIPQSNALSRKFADRVGTRAKGGIPGRPLLSLVRRQEMRKSNITQR